jgi:hypothetical protein
LSTPNHLYNYTSPYLPLFISTPTPFVTPSLDLPLYWFLSNLREKRDNIHLSGISLALALAAASPMGTYTLFCQLKDDPDGNPFSVKIDPNETIDELKNHIKRKNPHDLKDVDAARLVLWKVSPQEA